MVNVEIVPEVCPQCNIMHWIPEEHQDRLKKTKETFYCPNGHIASYQGKTDAQKLKEEKEKYEQFYKDYSQASDEAARLKRQLAFCKKKPKKK